MRELFNLGTNNGQKQFDQDSLKSVCPLMLFQLDSELCSNYVDEDQQPNTVLNEGKKKPSSTEGWQDHDLIVGRNNHREFSY